LLISNNGRFNLNGYYLHGTSSSDVSLATIDLSQNFNSELSDEGVSIVNAVYFRNQANQSLKLGEEINHVFTLSRTVYSLELIPIRFQVEKGSPTIVSCGESKIIQELSCTSGEDPGEGSEG